MMKLVLAPEPSEFDSRVRQKGEALLLELVGSPKAPKRRGKKRKVVANRIEDIPVASLKPLWNGWCLEQLAAAYGDICAYVGLRLGAATGARTVDHFKPKSRHPLLAYEWDNFRLAAARMNRNKAEHEDVLDPLDIEDGWFVLNLLDFTIFPARTLANATRDRVEVTITRLKLNAPVFCAARQEHYDDFMGQARTPDGTLIPPVPFKLIQREAPYVARELVRQGLAS